MLNNFIPIFIMIYHYKIFENLSSNRTILFYLFSFFRIFIKLLTYLHFLLHIYLHLYYDIINFSILSLFIMLNGNSFLFGLCWKLLSKSIYANIVGCVLPFFFYRRVLKQFLPFLYFFVSLEHCHVNLNIYLRKEAVLDIFVNFSNNVNITYYVLYLVLFAF